MAGTVTSSKVKKKKKEHNNSNNKIKCFFGLTVATGTHAAPGHVEQAD